MKEAPGILKSSSGKWWKLVCTQEQTAVVSQWEWSVQKLSEEITPRKKQSNKQKTHIKLSGLRRFTYLPLTTYP